MIFTLQDDDTFVIAHVDSLLGTESALTKVLWIGKAWGALYSAIGHTNLAWGPQLWHYLPAAYYPTYLGGQAYAWVAID